MSLPTMSIINFATQLDDREVQEAIRAVNRQVSEDFAPVWGSARSLRLHAAGFDPADPDSLSEDPVQGESVCYLIDEATVDGALGYHDLNTHAVPVAFVFVLNPNDWTVTLSHEVLELIVDPTVNILVPGPDPRNRQNTVLHAYEVCDAVERTSYEIDGVRVSNFVSQSYFTVGDEPATRNDFLGIGVTSFGVSRGSHIAFLDLNTGRWETVFGQRAPASKRLARKEKSYDHAKPDRPDDELRQRLQSYQGKPHPLCRKMRKSAGLLVLRGITRQARYQAAAEQLTGALRGGSVKASGAGRGRKKGG